MKERLGTPRLSASSYQETSPDIKVTFLQKLRTFLDHCTSSPQCSVLFGKVYIYYLVDWLLSGFILFFIFFLTRFLIRQPRQRFLSNEWVYEHKYDYPLIDETVPFYIMLLFFLIPPLIILFTNFLRRSERRLNIFLDLHHGILGCFVGFSLSLSICEVFKFLVGSYRPNYKAICNPDDTGRCQGVDRISVYEGMQSFPSGHSCTIFSLMTYTGLYVTGKMGVFSEVKGVPLYRSVVVLVPFMFAGVIACTRVNDYYHDFVDVLTGALIGGLVSCFGYFSYFPSLCSKNCRHPKNRYENILIKNKSSLLLSDAFNV